MTEPNEPVASEDLYYFGYGPMIHPTVRHHRGIRTEDERAAVLVDYRLTFAFGGVASVVRQTGYDVHGIVMKCKTQADWDKLQQSEGGYYATKVLVTPYSSYQSTGCEFSPEDDDFVETTAPILCRVFVMKEFDISKLDLPLEKLPQERYLRLIATGMQKYDVDEDYIQDQIMGVPYKPSRTPNEYVQFPMWQDETTLPRISFSRYQQLCENLHDNADTSVLYFIVGKFVIQIRNFDSHHPGFMWLLQNGHGKADVTFYLHQTHVDPDIPHCETKHDVTASTQAWAENLLVDSIAQGLVAHRFLELSDTNDPGLEAFLARALQSPSKPKDRRASALWKSVRRSFRIGGRRDSNKRASKQLSTRIQLRSRTVRESTATMRSSQATLGPESAP